MTLQPQSSKGFTGVLLPVPETDRQTKGKRTAVISTEAPPSLRGKIKEAGNKSKNVISPESHETVQSVGVKNSLSPLLDPSISQVSTEIRAINIRRSVQSQFLNL